MSRDHDDPYDLPLGHGGDPRGSREQDPRPADGYSGGPFEWGDDEPEERPGGVEPDPPDGPFWSHEPEPPPERESRAGLWVLLAALGLLVLLGVAAAVGYLLPREGPSVARIDPSMLDFGAVSVGEVTAVREVTVENAGDQPVGLGAVALSGRDAGAFEIAAGGCAETRLAAGRSCTVVVRFRPTGAGGARAVLEVETDARNGGLSTTLLGEGAAAEAADDRRPIDAPPVVDEVPDPPATLEGTPVSEPETPPALDPEPAPAPAPAPAPVPAPAPPPPPPPPPPPAKLEAEPAAVDFGEHAVGSRGGPETLTLRNRGGSPATVAGLALGGSDPGSFALGDDGCSGVTLNAGAACTVEVVFRPRQEGTQRARVEVRAPDLGEGYEGELPSVALAGAGATARLGIAPTTLSFGEVRLEGDAERDVVLSNRGRAPLEIRGVTVEGGASGDFRVTANGCPPSAPLAPGESCEVTVRFRPSTEGVREGVLVVRHRGAGGEGEATLRGTGAPIPAPRAFVDPAVVRFGGVDPGRRSEIVTVTLSNRGDARMAVGEVGIVGGDAGEFQIVAGSCEGASFLAPGSDCTVGVRFSPSASGSTGDRRARLVLPHGAPGGRAEVELTGRAGG